MGVLISVKAGRLEVLKLSIFFPRNSIMYKDKFVKFFSLKHKERMAVNKTVLRVLVGEYKKKN
jgi:hypothetical protein